MTSGSDPRQAEPPRAGGGEGEADVRPAVALPGRGLPGWLIAVGIVALALLLFTVLEARRRAAAIPAAAAGPDDALRTATAAPPLYLPPSFTYVPPPVVIAPAPTPTPTPAPPPPPPPAPQIVYVPPPPPAPVIVAPQRTERPSGGNAGSALVYDASVADPVAPTGTGNALASSAAAPGANAAAARARRLANRATTVAQGTLIPAVLESALDSTRPGPARALVTRNVRGADGSRILIPRGSKLFGEYSAFLAPGQNRALVTWTQLVRPDGATVALASPAADPLGRVGVKGDVDTHFLSRFGAALLQSVLDIGVNVASRRVNQQVVVALPGTSNQFGGGQGLGGSLVGPPAAPTLKVRQGVSISVFVARDLDFTGVQR